MLSAIEKFLFQQFPKMPQPVRVVTYLVMLFLFSYLLLIPKFIDGHLKIFIPTEGKTKDYRGATLRTAIEGRMYKYTTNEDGYWSIPVVSKLPSSVMFEVYDKDRDEWHKVELSVLQIWKQAQFEIVLDDKSPFIHIAAHDACDFSIPRLSYAMDYLSSFFANQAFAGTLALPSGIPSSLSTKENKDVQEKVFAIIGKVMNRQRGEISMNSPMSGKGAPTYREKISIIGELEQTFSMMIPDEHWQYFETVGQLTDYIEKRIIVERSSGNEPSKSRRDWQAIKDSFPQGNRPAYKY